MSVVAKSLRIAVAFSTFNFIGKSGSTLVSSINRKMASKIPTFTLNTGKEIPSIGYGTWQAQDEELEKAVDAALEAGYRHIDTAYVYENEKIIGKVLKKWMDLGKLKREDLFIVTKVPPGGNRPEGIPKFLKKSLENLQIDYIDLYLVHTPFSFKDIEGDLHPVTSDGSIDIDITTNHTAIWEAMEKQMNSGLVKAIGISNFNKTQLERILKNSKIKPSALQIELHAYLQQNELVDICKKNNILVTAYSPLGSPGLASFVEKFGAKIDLPDILGNPTVLELTKKHSKTPAQILLRFDYQRGIIPIPKSTNPERLKQNLDIFNFELDDGDLKKLKSLDAGIRILNFGLFKGVENHPEFPFKDELKK